VSPGRRAEWYPYLAVGAVQGRGRSERSAYESVDLTRATCNGQVHVATFQLTADEAGRFRGGRASVWAELDACSWNEATDTYIDQYAWFEGRVRVARH
jgi:hypothetical protein